MKISRETKNIILLGIMGLILFGLFFYKVFPS